MRIWIISDLHLEMEHWLPPLGRIPYADVCVVAGDVLNGVANSIEYLAVEVAPAMPVVLVPGNHEFYGDSVLEGLEWGRVAADRHEHVHLLADGSTVIGGVRFVGATLWTDYRLDGAAPEDVAWAMAVAEGRLNDHRQIASRRLPSYEAFTPAVAQALHARSRYWIKRTLQETYDGPTVVVTHHAPHPGSVHPRWKGAALNPCFASDLTEVIAGGRPELWVHGHMHDSADYCVGETRIICNPKGYNRENALFDPTLVVEV